MKNLILALITLFSTQAFASGGTQCEVETADIKLEVGLVNGRYFGSPIVSNSAVAITLKDKFMKEIVGQEVVLYEHNHEKKEIYSWYHLDNEMRLASAKEMHREDGWGIISFSVKVDSEGYDYRQEGTFKVNVDFSKGDQKINREIEGAIVCEFE